MRFRKALLAIMLLSMSEAVIAAPKETGTGTLPTELIERLDAPFRQGGNAANAGAPTTAIAPSGPQTRRLPGSVSGNIACNGSEFVGITISIDGEIEAATANSVKKLFDERAQQEKNLKAGIKCAEVFKVPSAFGDGYRINSRGGDVSAAMMIGRIFRQESAFLQVDGVCISACVLVLAGAVDRFVKNSFMIGIHRPYLAQTSYTDEQAQKLYDDMLKESFEASLIATLFPKNPPTRIHITERTMPIRTHPPIFCCPPPRPLWSSRACGQGKACER
jgi:hypothetical protein